ncbi:MAG: TlpA family protein disulfide reductase [Gammaproteobacteria bacterium]|nr:TlpA family protein disulfide reductase [Gammaproteobacteria bacterium]
MAGRAFVAGICLLCLAAAAPAPAAQALIGSVAPDFALKGVDGLNRRLSEYRGRVVLINFYARWAGDSRVEMPALDHLDATYRRAGLVVLGVSVDEDLERAREFAIGMHVAYPVLLDGGPRIGSAYAIERMPMTVLIDRSGIVRFVKVGYERDDYRTFVAEIRALLRE